MLMIVAGRTQDYQGRINSLDFHRSADLMVTAADNDIIKVYGLAMGLPQKVLHSKKYGISKVRFSHHHNSIIFASNRQVRYMQTAPAYLALMNHTM